MTIKFGIFGDSNFVCVKQAMDADMVDTSGFDIEFWGHAGQRFRTLKYANGAVCSDDPITTEKYSSVNKHGRPTFPVAEFDFMYFVGARINLHGIFYAQSEWAQCGDFMSQGLRLRHCNDYMNQFMGYKFAKSAAKDQGAKILVSPISFPTNGPESDNDDRYPWARSTSEKERDATWGDILQFGRDEGITILPQPDETVCEGLYTHEKYATDDHVKKNDYFHKNAAYGALILKQGLDVARATSA